jgi:osmotically inducible protein OsmC
MATRTATTTWTGDLQSGSGNVEMTSSKVGTYEVSWPKRIGDEGGGTTSPEELIAAAHSSCFAMAFSGQLAKAGGSNAQLTVRADVTIGPDPAGGFRIATSKLTVRGSVDGLDNDTFVKAAEDAKVGCPVSKALTGIEISVDAALGS